MSKAKTMNHFYNLSPDLVMNACEKAGFLPTGEFLQLNSYENRVFDIRLESEFQLADQIQNDDFITSMNKKSVIVKFYRPGRWDKNTILEEHEFLKDLYDEGIKAVLPLTMANQSTLMFEADMYVAFFPKIRAKMPDELFLEDLERIGRLVSRIHNIGARKKTKHRQAMTTDYYGGWNTLADLEPLVSPEVRARYVDAATTILEIFDDLIDPSEFHRIHGDAHRGNLLSTGKDFFMVDFDDFCMGPSIQDFWMLLSDDEEGNLEFSQMSEERQAFIKGYEEFREFPFHQLDWIPLLRGLRIISYAGWIAKRWSDPSFPRLFPQFGSYTYWVEETEALEKIAWRFQS